MNRTKYFDYIEAKLALLAQRINNRGKLNILDLHIHSENFYAALLNEIYGWKLENLNKVESNAEAVDLIDTTNKLIIQVSSSNIQEKVESALEKSKIKDHSKEYRFKFISISKEAKHLKRKVFKNPYNISFSPEVDILDQDQILKDVSAIIDIDKLISLYLLVKKELGNEIDLSRIDSNLAVIVNELSKVSLHLEEVAVIDKFEIQRKIEHNQLDATESVVSEHAKYHPRLDKIYSEFDAQGVNKSLSVLQSVHTSYVEALSEFKEKDSDFIFLKVLGLVRDKVLASPNAEDIPIDEIELCVKIVVVDAFIRCKIFKNPENYAYAIA